MPIHSNANGTFSRWYIKKLNQSSDNSGSANTASQQCQPAATSRRGLVFNETHTPAAELRIVQLVNGTFHLTVRRKLHHSEHHQHAHRQHQSTPQHFTI